VSASDGSYADKVSVSWGAVSGASYYRVYRSTTAGGTKTIMSSWQATTTFDDTSATPGATYYYHVRAATSSGGSRATGYSNYNTGWRALTAPSGVSASDGTSSNHVEVTWNPVTGASWYRVTRSETDAGVKTELNIQMATSYDDTNATPNVTYYYFVQAAISEGGSRATDYSDYDTGWRAGALPWVTILSGDGTNEISWTPAVPGWILQETFSLQTNWTDCASGPTNPVSIPSTEATMFYRLRQE
jgi:hypothetical protein